MDARFAKRRLLLIAGCAIVGLAISWSAATACGQHAELIVLDDLTVLRDRHIQSFDAHGVVLDDGMVLPWNRIVSARVEPTEQARFDELHASMAVPLARLEARIISGDRASLGEVAEPLFAELGEGTSPSAFLAAVGLAWARQADGQREAAVEPALEALRIMHENPRVADGLDAKQRFVVTDDGQIASEIVPLFFDASLAAAAGDRLAERRDQLASSGVASVDVYRAALALAAGDRARAEEALNAMAADDQVLEPWRMILAAQLELAASSPATAGPSVAQLAQSRDQFAFPARLVADYVVGLAELGAADDATRRRGARELLRIAARDGTTQPDLAAAALWNLLASHALDDYPAARQSLYAELVERYPLTWHARQAAALGMTK